MNAKTKFKSPDSAHKLFDLLMTLANDEYYFRGIQNTKQKYPVIMRLEGKLDLSSFEEGLLDDFVKFGSTFLTGNNNAIDCVAYAQHYGLPTRLVDWTRNPFIALFFSLYYANHNKSKPCLLFVNRKNTIQIDELTYRRSNNDVGLGGTNPIRDFYKFCSQVQRGDLFEIMRASYSGLYGIEFIDEVKESIQRKINENKMIFVKTGYSNARLLAQDGVFYIPKSLKISDIDQEYSGSEVEELYINQEHREELMSMLRHIGIEKSKLFFDPMSICEYIKERYVVFEKSLDYKLMKKDF